MDLCLWNCVYFFFCKDHNIGSSICIQVVVKQAETIVYETVKISSFFYFNSYFNSFLPFFIIPEPSYVIFSQYFFSYKSDLKIFLLII